MKSKRNKPVIFSGQSMIEVLIALGAAVIILTSITTAVITSLNNSQFSENQNSATQYSQQGLDIIRQIRDSNYDEFQGYAETGGTYCLADNSTILILENCNWGRNVESTFIRSIELVKFDDANNSCNANDKTLKLTEVIAKTSWSDGKCTQSKPYCHEAKLVSCLSSTTAAPAL